ncbi:uncharacterized protein [Euphorbia lathyris]|uniref:uncharacterized protein n=1 Tax=Euphorbia lathyris TaxID=212925 RepID=UPI0033142F54
MDSGLSWADQWDCNPDPPPQSESEKDKNSKGKDGSKNKLKNKLLNFKWMKDLRKKDQK